MNVTNFDLRLSYPENPQEKDSTDAKGQQQGSVGHQMVQIS